VDPPVLVIGVGNALRGDDAAGLEVVGRIAAHPGVALVRHEGEAIELLDRWRGAHAVVLVDTVRSGAPAGTTHRIDASAEPLSPVLRRASSHTIGIAEAIELARALGELPPRVIVYGVEGARFAAGAALSAEVAAVMDRLAEEVLREARSLVLPPPSGSH
jgi:hydrogenase maturation protease